MNKTSPAQVIAAIVNEYIPYSRTEKLSRPALMAALEAAWPKQGTCADCEHITHVLKDGYRDRLANYMYWCPHECVECDPSWGCISFTPKEPS